MNYLCWIQRWSKNWARVPAGRRRPVGHHQVAFRGFGNRPWCWDWWGKARLRQLLRHWLGSACRRYSVSAVVEEMKRHYYSTGNWLSFAAETADRPQMQGPAQWKLSTNSSFFSQYWIVESNNNKSKQLNAIKKIRTSSYLAKRSARTVGQGSCSWAVFISIGPIMNQPFNFSGRFPPRKSIMSRSAFLAKYTLNNDLSWPIGLARLI